MKIYFERSGGFAGLTMTVTIDMESLPADDYETLSKLIDSVDFFHLDEPDATGGYADGFQYVLTVEELDDKRTFHFSEGFIPADLEPLITELSHRAHYVRRI